MEKFHFSPENLTRTAKLSVPIDSAGKNKSKYVVDMWENFFGKAVKQSSLYSEKRR